jgi:hypothetical protein
MSEARTVTCDKCQRPLRLIDFYGEQLEGCLGCNLWTDVGGAGLWRKLPEADIEALKGVSPRPRPLGSKPA